MTIHTDEEYFAEEHKFGYKNGFNIAVAFTEYGNNREWELPKDVGTLRYRGYSWGEHANGTSWEKTEIFKGHECSREELGLEEDRTNAKFMPLPATQWN